MLAGILLHIIKLKTVYTASTLPISRKVKPAIQSYQVPIRSVKNFNSRFRN